MTNNNEINGLNFLLTSVTEIGFGFMNILR